MALEIDDLRDLLALLKQHPEWKEAVRRELLTEELLRLPGMVQRLDESHEALTRQMVQLTARVDQLTVRFEELTVRFDQLTVRFDQLTVRFDQLTVRFDQLTASVTELTRAVARLDGRVGNLEGWRYEQRFQARARVTEVIRRPVAVDLADLEVALEARDQGVLSENEWQQLLAIDFLFEGVLGTGPDAPKRLVVLEVSLVVDERDVQRAHDRAAVLARTGLSTVPAVGGRRVTKPAAALADRLGVRMLLDTAQEE